MPPILDFAETLWFLAKTGYRFRRALETSRMLEAGATPGLAYYAMISLWMDITGVKMPELWERRSFELFGLLSEYCMTIDRFVDTPEGGQSYLDNPKLWKRHPKFSPFIRALARKIRGEHLPRYVKRELLKALQSYRYSAAASLRHALQSGPLTDVESVLRHKEATSGEAFATCIDLLSIAHGIQDSARATLRSVLFHWGMCLQITDDLTDLSEDNGLVQNITVSMLLSHPQEKVLLEAVGMKSHKLTPLAPKTLAGIRSIFEQHLSHVEVSGLDPPLIKRMGAIAKCLFWMGTNKFSPLVFRSYVKGILRLLGSHKWRAEKLEHIAVQDSQFATKTDTKSQLHQREIL